MEPDPTGSHEENTRTAIDFVADFNVCYTPVLVTIGCVGNLLSIFVFLKSGLREQSTSVYLSALALTDTLFLCQLFVPWMSQVNISELYNRNGYCQLFTYLSYVTCNISAWLTVAFTFERFVAVIYPLRCGILCTVERARYIVVALVVLSMLFNIPLLIFSVAVDENCGPNLLYMDQAALFNFIDMIWSFLVPVTLIIALNTCIVVGVYRSERYRRRLTKGFHSRQTCFLFGIQRTTKMLLIVSTVFVMLNLPSYIIRIYVYQCDPMQGFEESTVLMQYIAVLCNYTNFGINFFLYCLSGVKFRHALYQTVPWLKCGRVTKPSPSAV